MKIELSRRRLGSWRTMRWVVVVVAGLALHACHKVPPGGPHAKLAHGLAAGVADANAWAFDAWARASRTRAIPAKPGAPGVRKQRPRKNANAAGDIFGYGDAFAKALQKIGYITPDQFARRHRLRHKYVPRLAWDPTKAQYWKKLQAPGSPFKLNKRELALYKRHGFVVSGRLAANSFAEMYYRIFVRDLPVLITTDSVLHAWHRSYDAVLEELESSYLAYSLDEILGGMAAAVPAARKQYGHGVLGRSLKDADYFIAVARSLLAGKAVQTRLGNHKRVTRTLAAVKAKQLQKFRLFGGRRVMDFSQFKVRGHYENSEQLKRYFRAMMWLGRVDMRVIGEKRGVDYRRQLGSAVVLGDLLQRAGRFSQWAQFDKMIQTFVGVSDSMTFAQLKSLLKAARIKSPRQVNSLAALGRLQARLARTKLGSQAIRSHFFKSSPYGTDKATLPRSFLVMGQKFTVDSWVTSKIVSDDVFWKKRGGRKVKVQRRMPSALDVAFAVFGNDATVPLLVTRMKNRKGMKFRDGLNYQHNLSAARKVMDDHPKKGWKKNLYMHWLATLRTLSSPVRGRRYPQAMRTRAWAAKDVNTQLASWTQLRHDTILYVKQSYTSSASCYYPHGLVEPRVDFWKRLAVMAGAASKLIRTTPYPNRRIKGVSLPALQKRHAAFFAHFAKQVSLLHAVAVKQLARKKLTTAEQKMVKNVVQISHGSGFTRYNGWYPSLFFKGRKDSGKYDALVADVHTNVPAPPLGDPGGVLHQSVGKVDLILMAARAGKKRIAYAGPTLSHYEFVLRGIKRKSDSEWKKDLKNKKVPPRPPWTRNYLVP